MSLFYNENDKGARAVQEFLEKAFSKHKQSNVDLTEEEINGLLYQYEDLKSTSYYLGKHVIVNVLVVRDMNLNLTQYTDFSNKEMLELKTLLEDADERVWDDIQDSLADYELIDIDGVEFEEVCNITHFYEGNPFKIILGEKDGKKSLILIDSGDYRVYQNFTDEINSEILKYAEQHGLQNVHTLTK